MPNQTNSQGAIHHFDERPVLPETPHSRLSLPPLRISRHSNNRGTLTNIPVSADTNCYTGVDQEPFQRHTVENHPLTNRVQMIHATSLSNLHESCGAFSGLQEGNAITLMENITFQARKAQNLEVRAAENDSDANDADDFENESEDGLDIRYPEVQKRIKFNENWI